MSQLNLKYTLSKNKNSTIGILVYEIYLYRFLFEPRIELYIFLEKTKIRRHSLSFCPKHQHNLSGCLLCYHLN